ADSARGPADRQPPAGPGTARTAGNETTGSAENYRLQQGCEQIQIARRRPQELPRSMHGVDLFRQRLHAAGVAAELTEAAESPVGGCCRVCAAASTSARESCVQG